MGIKESRAKQCWGRCYECRHGIWLDAKKVSMEKNSKPKCPRCKRATIVFPQSSLDKAAKIMEERRVRYPKSFAQRPVPKVPPAPTEDTVRGDL